MVDIGKFSWSNGKGVDHAWTYDTHGQSKHDQGDMNMATGYGHTKTAHS